MPPARRLEPPAVRSPLGPPATVPRSKLSYRDPVGDRAARNVDRHADPLQDAFNRRAD